MTKPSLLLLFLPLLLVACDNNDPDPDSITSGVVTLTQSDFNGAVQAFSFSRGQSITSPNDDGVAPDLIMNLQRSENNEPVGPFFSSLAVPAGFRLLEAFATPEEARSFFDNLSSVPTDNYALAALNLREGQVWAVRTASDTFTKILILSAEIQVAGSDATSIEVSFEWTHQSDGTPTF